MDCTLSPEQYLDAYRRVQAGETPAAVARSLGVHRNNLYRLIKRRGGCVPDMEWKASLEFPHEPTVRAYIAGIVDGEGSIYKRSQDGHWYLKVGMTDQAIIEWLAGFGGRLNFQERQEPCLPVYVWCVSRRKDFRYVLEVLLPYLRVKRDIALLALSEES